MLANDDNSQSRRVLSNQLAELISAHGYWIVAVAVALSTVALAPPLLQVLLFVNVAVALPLLWIVAC